MDFDTILYILLMVGWLGFTFFKALRKDEAERTAKKNRPRPIAAETTDHVETVPKSKKASTKRTVQQDDQDHEYFSYETMSDRDFAAEFGHSSEETAASTDTVTSHSSIHLSMDEDEVYKGIVWSEILKRKY